MNISLNSLRGAAVVLLFLSGLLAACGVPTQADQPGRAQIDEVSVQILESFPIQVEVLIKGSLADSCTEIEQVDQRFDVEEGIFRIEVQTVRNTEGVCVQALVPFEEALALDVYGLPAGAYAVDVNGIRKPFTLSVDNAPREVGLPNPASVYCQEEGYLLEIRTDEQGNQYGVCIFPDGSECDEWAFFRGECGPVD